MATSGACGGEETAAKAPVVADGAKDPASLAKIAQACARVSACTHAHDTARLRDPGKCVDWWLTQAGGREGEASLAKCLDGAKTCDDVGACMHGGGDMRAAQFCASRPGAVSGCDGDRLVSCSSDDDAQESTVVDCAKVGATCREVKSGGLVSWSCFSPQKCPAGAPEVRCDGEGAVLACHDGAIERVACTPGTRCHEHHDQNGEATASCELTGSRACATLGARHCEGDRLVECQGRGHFGTAHVTDCSALGLRCSGDGVRAGCYVPSNVECDKEMLPRCENTRVVFCAAGRLTRIACTAIGMSACDPSAKGPLAACTSEAPSESRKAK